MSLEHARSALPLRQLMAQHGDVVPEHKRSGFACPFCQKKSATLREVRGRQWFKCFNPACPSGTSVPKASMDEVRYLAFKLNLSASNGGEGRYSDAALAYLKMAGVWREAPLAPSIMPGQRARHAVPKPPPDPAKMEQTAPPAPPSAPPVAAVAEAPARSAPAEEVPAEVADASADAAAAAVAAPEEEAEPAVDDADGASDSQRALEMFYAKLSLTAEDAAKLRAKRGLSEASLALYGFKSSPESNREILEQLEKTFPAQVLVDAGLWTAGERGEYRPEPQLYGYGNTGQRKNGEAVWGWCHPVLIPYFNRQGTLVALRPHKGGVKNQGARLYLPPTDPAEATPERVTVVITEGEYKACALAAVLGGSYRVAALPGIQQSKNWMVWQELRDWLKGLRPALIYVAFDNEEKGNPALPGYKADQRKRYDAQIWARYLAISLAKQGYETRVVTLPAEWRDANGKADWDGRLSVLAAGGGDWAAVRSKARAEFARALRTGVSVRAARQAGLFSGDEEGIIQNGLERLFYVPRLACGGERERATIGKLRKLANGALQDVPGVDLLADAYSEVVGRYYILKPLTDKKEELARLALGVALKRGERDLVWFLNLKLKGIPDACSNFTMEACYLLQKHGGKCDRLVRLRNVYKESSPVVALDSESFSQPSKFRVWLYDIGGYIWRSGEKELQALGEDVSHDTAFRRVDQVVAYGWDPDSQLWFFKDCAFAANGEVLLPDESGIYWHNGSGYQIAERGKDNQDFRQGHPRMRPGQDLAWRDHRFQLVEDAAAGTPEERLEVKRQFFQEFSARIKETLGGYEGYMAIGLMLAYGIGPEIYAQRSAFPGLWLHGEKGQGKSTVTQWLMEMWGFHGMASGVGLLKSSTAVGLQIVAEQYSNLPVWLDEFRSADIGEDKRAIIHAAFNREVPSKWAVDGAMRRMRTSFLVVGESTSGDAATRSRYPHILVSAEKRQGDHWGWFQDHRPCFFLLGREALRRRDAFKREALEQFADWCRRPEMRQVDARAQMIYGVAWAAFRAMTRLLGEALAPDDLDGFRLFLVKHCAAAIEQVQTQVNVNQFWQDLVGAYRRGVFGETREERRRFFHVNKTRRDHAPGASSQTADGQYLQGPWDSYRLNLEPNGVIELMQRDFTQRRKPWILDRQDLREQMSRRPYWSPLNSGNYKQRFNGGKMRAWAIEVDQHELGYHPCTDEQLEASKYQGEPSERHWAPMEDWVDPRRGDLFALIEDLETPDKT